MHSMVTEAATLNLFLQTLLQDGRISESEYLTAVTLLQKDAHRQRQTEIPGAVTVKYSAVPSNQLATVAAVLNTRELLEQILGYLDTGDLVHRVSRTCHGFRNIVNTTPGLQRKLFLQPDASSALRYPSVKNVHYKVTHQYVEILIIRAGELLNSSSTLQQLLLMQPPVKAMQIFYDCSCRSRDAGILNDEDGLRFSHVADALNTHFKASQASSSKQCTCATYQEARLICKIAATAAS